MFGENHFGVLLIHVPRIKLHYDEKSMNFSFSFRIIFGCVETKEDQPEFPGRWVIEIPTHGGHSTQIFRRVETKHRPG